MIEQNVQVVACRGGRIWVRMGSQSGCTACDNGNGCGAGVFAKLLQRKPVVLELEQNESGVKPGQMVTLAFPEQVYIKLVLASYGWPLLAALAGAFAGHGLATWLQLGPGSIDTLTLLVGLLSGAFVMRYLKRQGNAASVLKSLDTMIYYPAEMAGMCSGAVKDTQKF